MVCLSREGFVKVMALRICSALSSNKNISSTPIKVCLCILPRFRKEQLLISQSTVSRRNLELSLLAVAIIGPLLKIGDAVAEEDANELEIYTDSEEGFTLLKPHSWNKVDKAGANVLFVEVNKGANSIGVVVNPVRLAKLSDFGTPEFVADKLIQAEKRKESTNDAMLIEVKERRGKGGLEVYEFEYEVDSSRGGLKKIFSAAFVASGKLYLLNITHSDKAEDPINAQTRLMLETVLHSFDLGPSA